MLPVHAEAVVVAQPHLHHLRLDGNLPRPAVERANEICNSLHVLRQVCNDDRFCRAAHDHRTNLAVFLLCKDLSNLLLDVCCRHIFQPERAGNRRNFPFYCRDLGLRDDCFHLRQLDRSIDQHQGARQVIKDQFPGITLDPLQYLDDPAGLRIVELDDPDLSELIEPDPVQRPVFFVGHYGNDRPLAFASHLIGQAVHGKRHFQRIRNGYILEIHLHGAADLGRDCHVQVAARFKLRHRPYELDHVHLARRLEIDLLLQPRNIGIFAEQFRLTDSRL